MGEGGIILLPGASIDESFTDEDEEELMRSLEGPPSPCDVVFVNDNVLIDGKSSISQKTKKAKVSVIEMEKLGGKLSRKPHIILISKFIRGYN